MNLKSIKVSIFAVLLGVSCGDDKSLSPSPMENVKRSVDMFSIKGFDKLYTCNPTDDDRQDEYIWIFQDAESGAGALNVAQIQSKGDHGIHHLGLVLITHLDITFKEGSLAVVTNPGSRGSFDFAYDTNTKLIHLDVDSLEGKVIDIKGYASELEIRCEKNIQ